VRQAGWAAVAAAGFLLAAPACAARRLPTPHGARVPAPEGVDAWSEATRACRGVHVYSSTIRLAGRVSGERIPSGLSVASGFDDAGGLRLEARMIGRRVFTLAGRPDRTVLLLHREREFVVGPADRILEALVGTKLAPADLLAILSGCITSDEVAETWRVGDLVEVVTGRARVYLGRTPGGWRPRIAFTAALQVDFAAFEGLWPSEIRIWSAPAADVPAELRLRIDTVQVNGFTLPDQAFSVDVPADASPIEIDALRGAVNRKGTSN